MDISHYIIGCQKLLKVLLIKGGRIMKIGIGCDHGGVVLKGAVIEAITEVGHDYYDYGTFGQESVDYPDYAEKVCKAIINGEINKGILICGTGIGISIAANKFKGIRCAHVTDEFQAQMSAEHNDANMIALGGRVSDEISAKVMVKRFLETEFAGGRHKNRVDKILRIEEKKFN